MRSCKMFIQNKYRDWYFQIIQRAAGRPARLKGTERHHVIPKSFGGTNEPSNLVRLYYREHFLVHWLLIKFTEGQHRQKMLSALWQMGQAPAWYTRIVSSWQYAKAKEALSEATSLRNIGNKYSQGRKWTEAQHASHQREVERRKQIPILDSTREKIRKARLGTRASEETRKKMSLAQSRRTHPEEVRQKIGAANSGKVRTPEAREKYRKAKLGKKLSLETRKRMSEAHKLRHSKRSLEAAQRSI